MYQNQITSIYSGNNCVKKISLYTDVSDSTKDKYDTQLKKQIKEDYIGEIYAYMNGCRSKFNELVTGTKYHMGVDDDGKSLLLNKGDIVLRKKLVVNKFSDKLKKFGLIDSGEYSGEIGVYTLKTPPNWVLSLENNIPYFVESYNSDKINDMVNDLLSYQCDIDSSFDANFTSDKIKNNSDMLDKYEMALDEISANLYGIDENGNVCDKTNPSPDSDYAKYLEAKEKYENDDYSQAEKTKKLAESGVTEMGKMLRVDEYSQSIMDKNYDKSIQIKAQPLYISRYNSLVVSQTVLDMLGFIAGMKKMTMDYPYIIQGITGLDTAYNKHYGIKDPYLGSGEDKITLTCLESLDLRVSSMFNRYFNAVYDRQYRRERVPVNLRRFNCSIYVHDIRNFVHKVRTNKDKTGKDVLITTYNRILELTDMYYSVIEFRFFDCEIVPEETGNIFSDVSNEAPSEMKKTNFTFTYGNCTVNFVPNSEVATHKTATSTNPNDNII
jgi:hypothetical protein